MKTKITFITWLRSTFHVVLLMASLVFIQGCAKYELRMQDSTPEHDLIYEEQMIHAYLWGKFYDPQTIMSECHSPKKGINDVIVKRSYWNDLASVFTFGIWMPIEITYRCQSKEKGRGTLPGQ